jgi:hypothetical protein
VSAGGVQLTKRPWFEGTALTKMGAATVVATTGSSSESAKERVVPSWAGTAHRVVDPAVKLPQSTVALPAADWYTWLLVNVDWADWDVVRAIWLPTDTQDVDEAELEQFAPRKKFTVIVELPMSVCPAEVICKTAVMVSGQRHRCGLKKPLESSAPDELPVEP